MGGGGRGRFFCTNKKSSSHKLNTCHDERKGHISSRLSLERVKTALLLWCGRQFSLLDEEWKNPILEAEPRRKRLI